MKAASYVACVLAVFVSVYHNQMGLVIVFSSLALAILYLELTKK